MREVLEHMEHVRAVLFDVDGTLYRQGPVRRAMIARLARAHWARPLSGARVMRIVVAYRRAQEELRASGFEGDVATAQLDLAAERTGVGADVVRACIERWMNVSPMDVVARSVRPGVVEVLDALAAKGVRLAAVSDYPAVRKPEALGIGSRFDVVLSAQDPRVQAIKPNPRGLLVALSDLGVAASDALHVGDRADVDALAAAAAQMRCVLVGGSRRGAAGHEGRLGRFAADTERLEAT